MNSAATRTALGIAFALSMSLLPGCADPESDTAVVSQPVSLPDLSGVQSQHAVELTAETWERIRQMAEVPALRANPTNRVADDADAARLGHRLFFEPGFSVDGSISCATYVGLTWSC